MWSRSSLISRFGRQKVGQVVPFGTAVADSHGLGADGRRFGGETCATTKSGQQLSASRLKALGGKTGQAARAAKLSFAQRASLLARIFSLSVCSSLKRGLTWPTSALTRGNEDELYPMGTLFEGVSAGLQGFGHRIQRVPVLGPGS